MAKRTKNRWAMPGWMEPYRRLIQNTGGNSVEDMMNDQTDPAINLPLSTLAACVKSQVGLLTVMRERGLLKPTDARSC